MTFFQSPLPQAAAKLPAMAPMPALFLPPGPSPPPPCPLPYSPSHHLSLRLSVVGSSSSACSFSPPIPHLLFLPLEALLPPLANPAHAKVPRLLDPISPALDCPGQQLSTLTAPQGTGRGRCPFYSLEGQGPSCWGQQVSLPKQGPSLRKPLHADCSSPRAYPHKDAKSATTLSALNVEPLFRMVLGRVRHVLPSPETSEDLKQKLHISCLGVLSSTRRDPCPGGATMGERWPSFRRSKAPSPGNRWANEPPVC